MMPVALERRDVILRSAVESHGADVFSKGGDGFGVAFAQTGEAVAMAVEAQMELVAEPWPEGAPIRMRMGLHTREVLPHDVDCIEGDFWPGNVIFAKAGGTEVAVNIGKEELYEIVAELKDSPHALECQPKQRERESHGREVGGARHRNGRALCARGNRASRRRYRRVLRGERRAA